MSRVDRKWTASPPAASNAMPYQLTDIDRLAELQRAVADATGRNRDPVGAGHWGFETIDDVVRRQNAE